MRYEKVQIRVDDTTIAAGDPWAVIEPVWWTADIYDGPEQYELSLLPFSHSQRLVFAVIWYRSEVENGGHHQFYSNSTGIVWKDALEAFRALEEPDLARILAESAGRLGGAPSLVRAKRCEQLSEFDPDFEDLDDRFYEADKKVNLDNRLMSFISSQPADFYFEGMIRRAVVLDADD